MMVPRFGLIVQTAQPVKTAEARTKLAQQVRSDAALAERLEGMGVIHRKSSHCAKDGVQVDLTLPSASAQFQLGQAWYTAFNQCGAKDADKVRQAKGQMAPLQALVTHATEHGRLVNLSA